MRPGVYCLKLQQGLSPYPVPLIPGHLSTSTTTGKSDQGSALVHSEDSKEYTWQWTRDQLIPTSVKHPIWYYITDPRSISISRKPSRTPEVLLPNGSGISSKEVGLVKPCYNPMISTLSE